MMKILLVAVGGALGSAGRYMVGEWSKGALGEKFPFATLLVNTLGCLAIGCVMACWSGGQEWHTNARLLVATGILGGFTTFSAFGHETQRLLSAGQTTLALANIGLNVVLGLAAVGVGARLGKAF